MSDPVQVRLSMLPLFANLPKETLRVLGTDAVERRFSAGSYLWLEGDQRGRLDWLLDGVVQTKRTSQQGREFVLAHCHAGDWLDLAAGVDGGRCRSSAIALTGGSLLSLSTDSVRASIAHSPALSQRVADALSDEARRLTERVCDLALLSARARLARFLLAQADDRAHGYRWTQEMIAAQIGSVRDVVGRLLREMSAEGLLRREGPHLRVASRSEMESVAELA